MVLVGGLAWSTISFAQVSDPHPVISRDDLREAIYTLDIDGVENAIAETQRLFLKGQATANDMRMLFQDFTTTNPKTIEFTRQWLVRDPDSAYANTAQAWILFTAGWIVRGNKYANLTYPDAMEKHVLLHTQAMEHAMRAYEADETLIPASDAVIKLGLTTRNQNLAIQVLERTMDVTPDWGSLKRGLLLTQRGYGGTAEMAEALCDYFGPRLDAPVADMVRYCKIYAIFSFHRADRNDELVRLIAQEPDSRLDYMRANMAINNPNITDKDVEYALWYFDNYDVRDIDLARNFDWYIGDRLDREPEMPKAIERAKTYARAELKHDPYDPNLLDILLTQSMESYLRDDGRYGQKSIDSPTGEERFEFARRRLVVAPYDPTHWEIMANSYKFSRLSDGSEAGTFLQLEPLMVNSIVYSLHDPDKLFAYMWRKGRQLTRVQVARLFDYGPELNASWDAVDEDAQIICPLLRGKRLYEFIRQSEGRPVDEMYTQEDSAYFESIETAAREAGKCRKVLESEIEELVLVPVPVDLGQYDTRADNPI